GAAARLDVRQRREQRVDRLRRRRRAVLRLEGVRAGPGIRGFRRRRHLLIERRRVLTAILHPRDELLLLVGRHRLEAFHHPRRIEATATLSRPAGSASRLAAGARPASGGGRGGAAGRVCGGAGPCLRVRAGAAGGAGPRRTLRGPALRVAAATAAAAELGLRRDLLVERGEDVVGRPEAQ